MVALPNLSFFLIAALLVLTSADRLCPPRPRPQCASRAFYMKVSSPLTTWACLGGDRLPRTGLTEELHELTDQKQMITASGFSDGRVLNVQQFITSSDFVQSHNFQQGDIDVKMPDYNSPCNEAGYVTVVTLGATQQYEVSPTYGLHLAHNSIDPVQSITAHCSTSSAYVELHYQSDFKMDKLVPSTEQDSETKLKFNEEAGPKPKSKSNFEGIY